MYKRIISLVIAAVICMTAVMTSNATEYTPHRTWLGFLYRGQDFYGTLDDTFSSGDSITIPSSDVSTTYNGFCIFNEYLDGSDGVVFDQSGDYTLKFSFYTSVYNTVKPDVSEPRLYSNPFNYEEEEFLVSNRTLLSNVGDGYSYSYDYVDGTHECTFIIPYSTIKYCFDQDNALFIETWFTRAFIPPDTSYDYSVYLLNMYFGLSSSFNESAYANESLANQREIINKLDDTNSKLDDTNEKLDGIKDSIENQYETEKDKATADIEQDLGDIGVELPDTSIVDLSEITPIDPSTTKPYELLMLLLDSATTDEKLTSFSIGDLSIPNFSGGTYVLSSADTNTVDFQPFLDNEYISLIIDIAGALFSCLVLFLYVSFLTRVYREVVGMVDPKDPGVILVDPAFSSNNLLGPKGG